MKRLTMATGIAVIAACVTCIANAAATVYDTASRRYSPYLAETETVVWENRSISDITSLSCTISGTWVSATSGTGVIYDRTPTSFSVQFQCVDGGDCKMVRAYFRQVGANIVAHADMAARDKADGYRGRFPDVVFDASTVPLATPASNRGYGVCEIEAFGDTTWTVDSIPQNEDGVVVNNGTLQVNVANDMTVSTAISGNGAIRFVGPGQAIEHNETFDEYVTEENQTFIEDANVFDLEITSAVFNGGWCGRAEGAVPYNVTSNISAKTMTVQLQKRFENNSLRGVVVQLSQSGSDVLIKGLIAKQAGSGQTEGSDANGWSTDAPLATASNGRGYGLESIAFVRRAVAKVLLAGTKGWTGGTIADDCEVEVLNSQLAGATDVRAVNGGKVVLSAAGGYSAFTRNRYRVEQDSELTLNANFAVNRHDAIDVDGGTLVRASDDNCYIDEMTLANGAAVVGHYAQIGCDMDSVWKMTGNEEVRVDAPVQMVNLRNSPTFIIDAAADAVFGGRVYQAPGNLGMNIAKRGAAKVTFAADCVTIGMVTLAEGTVRIGAAASFGPLVLSGNVAVEVADGATLTFDGSSEQSWAADAALEITGTFEPESRNVRIGTSADGLTAVQRKKIKMNGLRCRIDEDGYLHPVYPTGLIITFK